MPRFVSLDGRLVAERSARISVLDHGLLYGDGLYETVRAQDCRLCDWPAHWRRLRSSARALGIRVPVSATRLRHRLLRLLRAHHRRAGTLRITLTRGPGPLGLDPSRCKTPMLLLQLHPERDLETLRRGVSAAIVSIPRSGLTTHKTLNALPLVLAKEEAQRRGAFEGILLNDNGELTEGTTTNLFFVRKKILHTPAVESGLLPGITRAAVLRLARRLKVPVREGRYRSADLARADELFLTNSTLCIVPVTVLVLAGSGRKVRFSAPGPITYQLQRLCVGAG